MKVTLENTDRIVEVERQGRAGESVPGRVWHGYTETGIPVVFVVTRVQVPAHCDQSAFQRELQETAAPAGRDARAIDMRFII